jgi:hypothetical protein
MANKKDENALLASLNTIKQSPTQPANKKTATKKVAKKTAQKAVKKTSSAVRTRSLQAKQPTRDIIQSLPRTKRVWPD